MARPTTELILALRATADRLRRGARYRWSSFAHCNCGNLVQAVTALSPEEITEAAFSSPGDWGQQAREFCPGTGYPLEYVFQRLLELGLDPDDFGHLERLSDPAVLRRLGRSVELHHNRRQDVVVYLRAWADLLESESPTPAGEPELPVAAE
ncbi:MAG: hypothetical protein PVI30_19625 [Myxococcales bacterium]|jgi:hypothetical protein